MTLEKQVHNIHIKSHPNLNDSQKEYLNLAIGIAEFEEIQIAESLFDVIIFRPSSSDGLKASVIIGMNYPTTSILYRYLFYNNGEVDTASLEVSGSLLSVNFTHNKNDVSYILVNTFKS